MKHLLLFLLVFTTLPLFAQKSLEVAYESSDYTYREPAMSTPISLKGKLRGASLRYETRMRDSGMFAAFEGRWMGGTTDYDGWLQSADPSDPPAQHKVSDIGDYYYEARLHLGQAYDFTPELQLWIGSGLAYRYLKDHMNKDPYGYLRESKYFYMPFTASLRYNSEWFSVALNGEFDFLIFGKQMSHLGESGLYYDDVRNDQHKGFGLRAGLKMQANVIRQTGIFIEPFYRYWQIADSQISNGFVEPYNTTEEYGIRVGFTIYLGGNDEVYSF